MWWTSGEPLTTELPPSGTPPPRSPPLLRYIDRPLIEHHTGPNSPPHPWTGNGPPLDSHVPNHSTPNDCLPWRRSAGHVSGHDVASSKENTDLSASLTRPFDHVGLLDGQPTHAISWATTITFNHLQSPSVLWGAVWWWPTKPVGSITHMHFICYLSEACMASQSMVWFSEVYPQGFKKET